MTVISFSEFRSSTVAAVLPSAVLDFKMKLEAAGGRLVGADAYSDTIDVHWLPKGAAPDAEPIITSFVSPQAFAEIHTDLADRVPDREDIELPILPDREALLFGATATMLDGGHMILAEGSVRVIREDDLRPPAGELLAFVAGRAGRVAAGLVGFAASIVLADASDGVIDGVIRTAGLLAGV